MYITKFIVNRKINDIYYLVVNTLTGAIDILSNNIINCLSEDRVNDLDEETIGLLRQRGYIFEDIQEEEQLLVTYLNKYDEVINKNDVVKFVISPTGNCNLSCIYCAQHGVGDDVKSKLMVGEKVEYIFKAIDRIMENEGRKAQIELYGGEPLLPANIEVIEQVFALARSRELKITIITNGAYLLRHYKSLILQNQDLLNAVQLTLDGPKEIHNQRRKGLNDQNNFDDVVNCVSFLLEPRVHVLLRTNIDFHNINCVAELAQVIKQNKWNLYSNFTTDLAPVRSRFGHEYEFLISENQILNSFLNNHNAFKKYNDLFKFKVFRVLHFLQSIFNPELGHELVGPYISYCESNRGAFYVFGADDKIYACTDIVGTEGAEVGYYYPHFNMIQENINKWIPRNIVNVLECRNCNIAPLCGGGCAAEAFVKNGMTLPVCNGAHDVVCTYLDYHKEQLLQDYMVLLQCD